MGAATVALPGFAVAWKSGIQSGSAQIQLADTLRVCPGQSLLVGTLERFIFFKAGVSFLLV